MFVSCLLSLSVPQPTVSVSLNRTGPLFAGTGLTISCTVTLDSSVNNNERVTIDWGDIPPERYSVSPVMRESDDGSYTGRLTISPLADEDDGTTLTCTGTVTGGTETQSSSSSDEVTITVEGEWINVALCKHLSLSTDLPDPEVAVSGPTTGRVGDMTELTCTVTTVAHLSPDAELTVTWSGGSEGDSRVIESDTVAVSGTTSERNLTFSSLNTSHGAQYTCQAVINIPLIGLMKTGSDSTDLRVKS